jgi:Secretion system C-terminal sorting domain
MKRTILTLLTIAGFTAFSFGQIEMTIGASGDLSGTQVDYTSAGAEVIVDVHVSNISGVSRDLSIARQRINETTGWTDYLCWGHSTDPFGGSCYPASLMNFTAWTTPAAVTVGDNEAGSLAIHILPEGDNGCTIYRYFVMDGTSVLDSIDISVCKIASVEELEPFSISVAPNPANSYVKIKTTGVDGASFKIVDVLGNVVMKEAMMGTSKTINTDSFKNGVYFIIVESEGQKPINRKVIVRH